MDKRDLSGQGEPISLEHGSIMYGTETNGPRSMHVKPGALVLFTCQ